MAYDDTTGLPTETHQAPASIPKANPEPTVPLGSGITINGETYTTALIQLTGGASDFPIFNPPFTDELRTYIVKAKFDGFGFVTRGDETHLVIKMKHYVFYDRDLGPLNDMQKVDTPEEIAELKRKAKDGYVEETEVDEKQPALFGDAPEPDADHELPEGPEWGDAEAKAQKSKDDGDDGRPSFSSGSES